MVCAKHKPSSFFFFLVPTILQEKHRLIHNKSQTTAMPHLGPDNDNETANTHSLTNLEGSSIQEQSNQPKKDSVQDDNENEPQKKSFCASSIINHTDKELPKVDNTTPPDDEPTHIHHIKHPQYKIIAENKSKGNGVYVGMIPEEDQYISDNGKHVKTPDLKPKVITPTPEQLKRCEQNRLRALQKKKDNRYGCPLMYQRYIQIATIILFFVGNSFKNFFVDSLCKIFFKLHAPRS